MDDNKQKEKNCETAIENLALQNGLAIVVAKDRESNLALKANNNSLCENLYSSETFAPMCAAYCGKAFEKATVAGETLSVQCYAGLHYDLVPFVNEDKKQFVAIVGRAFLKSEEYKEATERAISGDWKEFPPAELFKNIHLKSGDGDIEKTVKKFEKILKKEKGCFRGNFNNSSEISESDQTESAENIEQTDSQAAEISRMIAEFNEKQTKSEIVVSQSSVKRDREIEESATWRAVFGSLLELEYKNVYPAILNFLSGRYSLPNLAWLENSSGNLKIVFGYGDFAGNPAIEIGMSGEDHRLLEAIENETSLELRERGGTDSATINLFPIAVGGQIGGGLLIGDKIADNETKQHIARFVQHIAAELEILRLREKVERQQRTTRAVNKLNATLKEADEENFWTLAAQIAAELMRAERGSLLLVNEDNQDLVVKAAVGSRADIIKQESPQNIGKRVAQQVLESGKPLIVKDMREVGIESAPPEWKYKSKSFISYPIIIGGRKIGVLNVTDTIDGENYDESDLELLDTLSPQLAVAIDRTSLKRKTVELRQISITDSLTGLLNRRYLEERLAEEVSRSQRHNYQMCFMMIDVDEFKSYNDNFSHPEGDKALQIVGQCLKATLRGADVAARYGGEEFSILLPQTNINEAYVIAERLREKVMMTEFPNRPVTISIGIATCSAELCNAGDIISAADKALYQAKSKGRNNVQIFQKTV